RESRKSGEWPWWRFRLSAEGVQASGNLGNRPPRAQGLGERAFVEIVELAADRQAVRELGEADGEFLQPLGQVMGRGLALERGVHRQDDLVDAARRDALHQLVDAEVFGAHAFEGREPAAKDMVAAGKEA